MKKADGLQPEQNAPSSAQPTEELAAFKKKAEKLITLKEAGLLTEEEFCDAKAKLLESFLKDKDPSAINHATVASTISIPEQASVSALTDAHNDTENAMRPADSEHAFREAAEMFGTVSGFQDADALAVQCLDKAEECRKDAVYSFGKAQMAEKKATGYVAAIKAFRTIPDWRDSDEQIGVCKKEMEQIKAKKRSRTFRAGTQSGSAQNCRRAGKAKAQKIDCHWNCHRSAGRVRLYCIFNRVDLGNSSK